MTGAKLPNGELTTQAWIATYTGIPAGQVAGALPAPSKWTAADRGVAFLQVRALPGGPVDSDLPHRRTTVTQVDAWGARTVNDTFRPLWGVTMDLMERLRIATFPDAVAVVGGVPVSPYGKPVTMPLDGFLPARALSAYFLDEPRRVEDDPSGYARMTCSLSLTWTV